MLQVPPTATVGRTVVLLLCAVVVSGAFVGSVGGTATTPELIIVAGSGGGDYQTIQAGIDAASAGDTVVVRPGTYEEQVVVDETITLTAPRGATLDGGSLGVSATGITIPAGSAAAPTVDGLTITSYDEGVNASGTAGDWALDSLTVTETNSSGIVATNATGSWSVRRTAVDDTGEVGILANGTTGDWTLEESRVSDVSVGVLMNDASGEPRIAETTVTRTSGGVVAVGTTDSWAVLDSELTSNVAVAVYAVDTDGPWRVTNTVLTANGKQSVRIPLIDTDVRAATVNATGASVTGDATRNWWGDEDGPEDDDCVGAVDCSRPLEEPPVRDAVSAVASLEDADGDYEFIEVLRAIELFASGAPVPGTDDETLSFQDVLFIIGAFNSQ